METRRCFASVHVSNVITEIQFSVKQFSALGIVFMYDCALPNGRPSSPHSKPFLDRVLPLLAPLRDLDPSLSLEGANHAVTTPNSKEAGEKEDAIRMCKTSE